MKVLALVLLQFVASIALADTFKIKLSQDQITEVRLEGEYGGATHSMFNFIQNYYSSPVNSNERSEYKSDQFIAKHWAKYPDEMDGDGFIFKAVIDGVKNKAYTVDGSILVLEGEIAETLISGMWTMYRSYENNFTVARGGTHGDITMIDLFSNEILCSVESRWVENLSKRFATCTIQADLVK